MSKYWQNHPRYCVARTIWEKEAGKQVPHPYKAYRSTTSAAAAGEQWLKLARNHAELTPEVFRSRTPSRGAGGLIPIMFSTMSLHPSDCTMPVTATPSNGSPRIMATSCRVTVISPQGRWKVWVSGRQRSTKAVNRGPSIAGSPSLTTRAKGSRPARRMYGAYLSSHLKGE